MYNPVMRQYGKEGGGEVGHGACWGQMGCGADGVWGRWGVCERPSPRQDPRARRRIAASLKELGVDRRTERAERGVRFGGHRERRLAVRVALLGTPPGRCALCLVDLFGRRNAHAHDGFVGREE